VPEAIRKAIDKAKKKPPNDIVGGHDDSA